MTERGRTRIILVILQVLSVFFYLWQAHAAEPPEASVWSKVIVPDSMRGGVFDTARYLKVPPDFSVSVYARVSGARFATVTPNGDLLVSQPGAGTISIVRPNGTGEPIVGEYLSGLQLPHDMVFRTIGLTTYLYVSESNKITRYTYRPEDGSVFGSQVLIANLPDASNTELQGNYGHQLKNIALDSGNNIYVAIGSGTNSDEGDVLSNPIRGAIYKYDPNGGNPQLFAKGIRNAEGLAFIPGTNELWAAVNNQDELPFPYHADYDRDGADDFGKVMSAYVDNHPPELFLHVRSGADFGWPYATPYRENGSDNMPFSPAAYNNPNWSKYPPAMFTPVDKGIQAHSAPLGVTFLQNSGFHPAYNNGVVIALHGSWNRRSKAGYKLIYFLWNPVTNRPGKEITFIEGWLNNLSQENWGRPVDIAVDKNGTMFITDDSSGTVYKVTHTP